jgi:hypothetical protein
LPCCAPAIRQATPSVSSSSAHDNPRHSHQPGNYRPHHPNGYPHRDNGGLLRCAARAFGAPTRSPEGRMHPQTPLRIGQDRFSGRPDG